MVYEIFKIKGQKIKKHTIATKTGCTAAVSALILKMSFKRILQIEHISHICEGEHPHLNAEANISPDRSRHGTERSGIPKIEGRPKPELKTITRLLPIGRVIGGFAGIVFSSYYVHGVNFTVFEIRNRQQ